jgi:large subunit ribosomal protein L4
MELEIYSKDGNKSGSKVKLPEHVFGIEPNEHAVYLAVKVQRTNDRQGNAASKGRSQVRGGGRKPWKQKGRGVARSGSTRSPLWVGGGRVFGPQSKDYAMKLPRRVKALARASVLSDRVTQKRVTVLEDFRLEQAKTKELFTILKGLGLEKSKTLLLLTEYDNDMLRAGRNLPNLTIRVATTESTIDLLNCERILIQKSPIKKLTRVLSK